jgi:hypothetical protein
LRCRRISALRVRTYLCIPPRYFLFAFYVVSVTGSLVSRYRGEAFFGENNRYQGLLTLFAMLALSLSSRGKR